MFVLCGQASLGMNHLFSWNHLNQTKEIIFPLNTGFCPNELIQPPHFSAYQLADDSHSLPQTQIFPLSPRLINSIII